MPTGQTTTSFSFKMTKRPIVLSGPSGAGKSTLIKKLFVDFPNRFGFSVSHTTRGPRPGETHGKDYFFISREKFEEDVNSGKFIEHAEFSGNHYGTSIDAVLEVSKSGKQCILDIDMQGVLSLKRSSLNPFYVSIQPPSIEILENRLKGRGTETDESIKKRLIAARKEIEFSKTAGVFDLIIINDDLERSYQKLKKFIEENSSV
ncbi:Guanylate kinase/L-type calcium channel domain-containing protein [Rozella allomycis CSF55]|uniref:Guanylate kinase n=1 Tax=Rozella allomycis (strain CSF55) TaxID=988480 RepID=A0A075ARR3_ROZAC|nr:Guanylate kinase/L-type calcium channel domain-containing protein [Rozella allomycis CSF55]|eukprot:EPZ32971.1 Guanylate kinase/L-type calcium channel domain-containing protein [Rozella allomycis CSF55]